MVGKMPKHDEPAVTKMFTMRLYWVRTISAEHRNQEDEVELRESSVAVKISSFFPTAQKVWEFSPLSCEKGDICLLQHLKVTSPLALARRRREHWC
jgi:hypothetical protein